jgi:hypothetical protein
MAANGTGGRAGLESLDWENWQSVQAWQHNHAQLHAALDRFFGISST